MATRTRYRARLTQANARGFTLLEMLVAIIVGILMLSMVTRYAVDTMSAKVGDVAADHLKIVTNGTLKYIADNKQTILDNAGATSPYVVATSVLVSGGYLPPGFSTTNPFGQTYETRIVQPSAGVLLPLLVTKGGDAVSDKDALRVSRTLGAAGGLIRSNDTTKAQGTYGGWQVNLSPYSVSPGRGHLAVALFMASATAAGIVAASPSTGNRFFSSVTTGTYDGGFTPYKYTISAVYCPSGWTRDAGGFTSGSQSFSTDETTWPAGISQGPVAPNGWRVSDSSGYYLLTAFVDCSPP